MTSFEYQSSRISSEKLELIRRLGRKIFIEKISAVYVERKKRNKWLEIKTHIVCAFVYGILKCDTTIQSSAIFSSNSVCFLSSFTCAIGLNILYYSAISFNIDTRQRFLLWCVNFSSFLQTSVQSSDFGVISLFNVFMQNAGMWSWYFGKQKIVNLSFFLGFFWNFINITCGISEAVKVNMLYLH